MLKLNVYSAIYVGVCWSMLNLKWRITGDSNPTLNKQSLNRLSALAVKNLS